MGRHGASRALAAIAGLALVAAAGCTGSPGQGDAARHRSVAGGSTSTTARPTATAPAGPGAEGVPALHHVFVVLMENLGAQSALAVPSIAALAARYQSTTGWYAPAHPSLPNYLALASGSTHGVTSDCTDCLQDGPDLATQLTSAGVTWGGYFGGMPAPCFLGPQSPDGSYAQKHDPFAYFKDVRDDKATCSHLQPLGTLEPLLAGPSAGVPSFVWVTPTMCDSGHDCGGIAAGTWLTSFVRAVTTSAAWNDHGLLVVTWDEGDADTGLDPATGSVSGSGGGPVLTIVAGPGLPSGRRLPGPYSHYSLLRTIEDAFGLSHLGAAGAPGVRTLSSFFATGAGAG